ncbi:MAG: ketoacyl-ACP synthase III [Deltaproteobacteria bacterium]|nr:ketoacyl-ACP synthase III [Deltaproteobacteria bacterium]
MARREKAKDSETAAAGGGRRQRKVYTRAIEAVRKKIPLKPRGMPARLPGPWGVKTVPVAVAGIGGAVPARRVTTRELIDTYKLETTEDWVHEKLGIDERRYASPDVQTSDLAAAAALKAIEMAGIDPLDIGGISVMLGYGDVRAPATACYVQRKIGAWNAFAVDVDCACSGFIIGCEMGRRFVQDGSMKAFLAIGADVGSRTKVDPHDRTLGMIFGDAAAAAVLTRCDEGEGILSGYIRSDGRAAEIIGVKAGGSVMPISHEAVKEGHHLIKMDGPGVWNMATRGMPEAIREACGRLGIKPQHLDFLVTHQANLRLIEAVMKLFDLPMGLTHTTVQKFGNTSAASVGVTLADAFFEGKVKKGDLVCLAGVGAGFTWAADVIRWSISAEKRSLAMVEVPAGGAIPSRQS